MMIYIAIVVLLLIESYMFRASSQKKGAQLFAFIATMIFLALVAGMRDLSVGHDTANYANIYKRISRLSLDAMLGENRYSSMEQGFVWLCWLFSKLTDNYSHFLIAAALFQHAAIGSWIWKNAKKPFLSLLVFVCMFYTFFLTGIRQGIAFAILLLSYEDIKKRKLTGFLLKLFIASLFHQSALIFIAIYFLAWLKIDCKKLLWISLIAVPILFATRRQLFYFVINIFDRYSDYEILTHGDAVTYTLMLALIAIASVVMLYVRPIKNIQEEQEYISCTNCVLVSLYIMPFVGLNGAILRVAMYFSIFVSLMVEKLYGQFVNRNDRRIAQVVSISVLIVLFLNELIGSSYLYEFVGFDKLLG